MGGGADLRALAVALGVRGATTKVLCANQRLRRNKIEDKLFVLTSCWNSDEIECDDMLGVFRSVTLANRRAANGVSKIYKMGWSKKKLAAVRQKLCGGGTSACGDVDKYGME